MLYRMNKKSFIPKHLRFQFDPEIYEYTYTSFRAMHQRCNPANKDYKYYKNIKITDSWNKESGFKNFITDMGLRPKGLTLERIDNDGDYEPKNCKWASRKDQGINTRKVHNQREKFVKSLCLKNNIKYHSIDEVAKRNNISHIVAYERFIKNRETENNNLKSFGYKTIAEYCRENKYNYQTIIKYMNNGLSLENAVIKHLLTKY